MTELCRFVIPNYCTGNFYPHFVSCTSIRMDAIDAICAITLEARTPETMSQEIMIKIFETEENYVFHGFIGGKHMWTHIQTKLEYRFKYDAGD